MIKAPTTFEMDGLFTPGEIADRHRVMMQCSKCLKYTEQDNSSEGRSRTYEPCEYCKSLSFVINSTISVRTYNPNKKKAAPKATKAQLEYEARISRLKPVKKK